MFDIGGGELLVIGIVALVVIGPKELPGVIRGVGQTLSKVRRMAADFQGQFNEALREAELTDLKKSVDEMREGVAGLRSIANPLSAIGNEVRDALDTTTTFRTPPTDGVAPSASVEPGAAVDVPAVTSAEIPAPVEPAPVDLSELTTQAEPTAAAPAAEEPAVAAEAPPSPTPPKAESSPA